MAEVYIPANSPLAFEILCRAGNQPAQADYGKEYVGDDIDVPLVTTYNAQPVDLSTTTVELGIFAAPGTLPALLVKTATPPLGPWIRITDIDTVALGAGKFYYEMEYTDAASGLTATVQIGYLTLLADSI
jgi:hypothetical protein